MQLENSIYTNLEQSLACKEMGAEQDWNGPGWVSPSRGDPYFTSNHEMWIREHESAFAAAVPFVAALPFYTDDPNEQSVVRLLATYDIHPMLTREGKWQLHETFDSLGALLMACYEKWKLNNAMS